MSYIIVAFLIYLLYRFVTGFLLPVIKTTRQIKKQFSNMQQAAGAQQQGQHTPANADIDDQLKPKYDVEGEYIPFEEVK